MASSKVRKKRVKRNIQKTQKKEKISETIEKKVVETIINSKRTELKKTEKFLKRLKITVQLEQTKISELEGAILALHEVLTGEKVK